MRHLAILLGFAVVALAAAATTAAAPPQHVTLHVDDHFESAFLSDACGVAVVIDFTGDFKVKLTYNGAGLVTDEFDSGGATNTFRSPDTGKSFSFPSQPSHWDYGSGAVLGSSVIVTITGLSGHVPGAVRSDAGFFRFKGVVTGFDENGIPLVDFVDVIVDKVNHEDGDVILAGICGALT